MAFGVSIHSLRQGRWLINHKKPRRIYCEEGLNRRRKRPNPRGTPAHREASPVVTDSDEHWSVDIVRGELFNGRRIGALTVVDNFGSVEFRVGHATACGLIERKSSLPASRKITVRAVDNRV